MEATNSQYELQSKTTQIQKINKIWTLLVKVFTIDSFAAVLQ